MRRDTRLFFACGSSAPVRAKHEGATACLACGDPGGSKCAGTWTASAAGVMALSESFFEPLAAGDQKASLASLSPYLHPLRHLKGFFAWGPSLLFGMSGTYRGPLTGILLCR